ncbi:MAG: MBL fold metallo-hydrolase [Dehalococcoidales bacterium]|nr:MBL fold metallo-hydrolase [Dehalococcoidales bacterium]
MTLYIIWEVAEAVVVRTIPVGLLETNCYLVGCETSKEGMVIDPAAEPERLLQEIADLGLRVRYVVNTHGHLDHILANDAVRQATGAPLLMHEADARFLKEPDRTIASWIGAPGSFWAPDRLLEDGATVTVGELSFEVLHTPGHTPGGISLYGNGVVFTGDTLFNQGVGRTDLWGGNWRQLQQSIQSRLFTLPDSTIVYPGHGAPTTIGAEKADNPYI